MIFRRSWTVSALSSVFRSGSSNLSEAGAYWLSLETLRISITKRAALSWVSRSCFLSINLIIDWTNSRSLSHWKKKYRKITGFCCQWLPEKVHIGINKIKGTPILQLAMVKDYRSKKFSKISHLLTIANVCLHCLNLLIIASIHLNLYPKYTQSITLRAILRKFFFF